MCPSRCDFSDVGWRSNCTLFTFNVRFVFYTDQYAQCTLLIGVSRCNLTLPTSSKLDRSNVTGDVTPSSHLGPNATYTLVDYNMVLVIQCNPHHILPGRSPMSSRRCHPEMVSTIAYLILHTG